MLLAYAPAFVSALSSLILLLINNNGGSGDRSSGVSRLLLVNSALTVHFLKRILETLFVHKYSGKMVVSDSDKPKLSDDRNSHNIHPTSNPRRSSPGPVSGFKAFLSVAFLNRNCR